MVLPFGLLVLFFGLPQGAVAFPTWIGTYPPYERADWQDYSVYYLLANEYYDGLHANIGIKIGDGEWQEHPMLYAFTNGIDTVWWYWNDVPYPADTGIEYYFHVWDDWGAHAWDNNLGENYEFRTPSSVKWIGNAHHWPPDGEIDPGDQLWINADTWPTGSASSVEVVFTSNGQDWEVAAMSSEVIENNDHWYINIGSFPENTHIQYAIHVRDHYGDDYWLSNDGQDYHAWFNDGGTPVQWIGNSYAYPSDFEVPPGESFWFNTEIWPARAAVSGKLIYSLSGGPWRGVPFTYAGQLGNNDWWHGAIGALPPGVTITYRADITDGIGQVFSEPQSGYYEADVIGDDRDRDFDHLPDDWEDYWWSSGSHADSNPDNDGPEVFPLTSYIEWALGTNPRRADDHTRIPLLWSPSLLIPDSSFTISYDPRVHGILQGEQISVLVGHNGWQTGYSIGPMSYDDSIQRYSMNIAVPENATEINMVFFDEHDQWDNNFGIDWAIPVVAADLDGDGLLDSWERDTFGSLDVGAHDDSDADGLSNYEEYLLGTDPKRSDSDWDGLSDWTEQLLGLNPLLADSDGNGVSDSAEDHDGDGFTNGEEQNAGTDPRDSGSFPGVTDFPPAQWHYPLRTEDTCDGQRSWRTAVYDARTKTTCTDKQGHTYCCMRYTADWKRETTHQFFNVLEAVPVFYRLKAEPAGSVTVEGANLLSSHNGVDTYSAMLGSSAAIKFVHHLQQIGVSSNGVPIIGWPKVEVFDGPHYLNIRSDEVIPSKEETAGLVIGMNNNDDDGDGVADHNDDYVLYGDPSLKRVSLERRKGQKVRIAYDSSIIRLYEHPSKKLRDRESGAWIYNAEIGAATTVTPYQGYDDQVIYIEGITPGTTYLELQSADDPALKDRLKVTVINPGLTPDYDRDGSIGSGEKTNAILGKVFHFWINDDDDDGFEDDSKAGKQDVPGAVTGWTEFDGRSPDYKNGRVDGQRDWVDFFPVFMDVKETLDDLGTADFEYYLTHTDGAVNALLNTYLGADHADEHLRDYTFANDNSTRGVVHIPAAGYRLPQEFLDSIMNDNLGLILLEGRSISTDGHLTFEVRDTAGNVRFARKLALSLDSVENMFYHLDIRGEAGGDPGRPSQNVAPNYPDELCNNKHFVFIHGYNVNAGSARGWQAEFFKRMYWSGNNARFHAVTWYGEESQWPLWTSGLFGGYKTPDYHGNVVNAWQSAPALRDYIADLDGKVYVAAHSLGNMLASCAVLLNPDKVTRYFMLNAAVASEAFDPSATSDDMIHRNWLPYEDHPRLFTSSWHELFDDGDRRTNLTWKGRFQSIASKCVNLYSSGDQVLEPHPKNEEPSAFKVVPHIKSGRYSWAFQEKRKGTISYGNGGSDFTYSAYGGWGLNADDYGEWLYDDWTDIWYWTPESTEKAADIPESELVQKPFFSIGHDEYRDKLFTSNTSEVNEWLSEERTWRLIAGTIPAASLAAGRYKFATEIENSDMNKTLKPQCWPIRGKKEWLRDNWLHSDVKNMAYIYTLDLYDKLVASGELR